MLSSPGHRNSPVTVLRAPCKVGDTRARKPINHAQCEQGSGTTAPEPRGERLHRRKTGEGPVHPTEKQSMARHNLGGGLGVAWQEVPQGQSPQVEFAAASGLEVWHGGCWCWRWYGGTVCRGRWQLGGCRSWQGPQPEIQKHSGRESSMAVGQRGQSIRSRA